MANCHKKNSTLLSHIGVLYIDHIAVTTNNLEKTLADYISLPGARLWKGPSVNTAQDVRYAFVQVSGGVTFEILAPLSEKSPIRGHLSRGGGVYHICYAVDDIDIALDIAKKMGATCMVAPTPDPAFDDRRIAFILHQTHGLMELVEAYPKTYKPSLSNDLDDLDDLAKKTNNSSSLANAEKLERIFHHLMPMLTPAEIFNATIASTPQWDSLMQIRLIMALELELDCNIPSTIFDELTSFREISNWIEANFHSKKADVLIEKNSLSKTKFLKKNKSDARILQNIMKSSLRDYEGRPALIHTDILYTQPLIANTEEMNPLESHKEFFNTLPINCLIPAFNYQFPKLKKLDLRTAPIEVGSLNQYLHECNWANYRSFDPMFSVLGRGNAPFQPTKNLDAFGRESIFSYLEKGGGAIVMYGAKISSLTFLHYIESKIEGVPYRYKKSFSGELIDDHGILHHIEWTTHVRPWGCDLDYDWIIVENILRDKGVLQPLVNGYPKLGFYVDARACVDVLKNELHKDPLIFLDTTSRAWVEPKLNELGRAFLLSDFENKE
ncbi:VOC family protein [Aeromonas hydrophila]|uniref:VOC family protein n=1 Tax=Aeromonas hydrophila TaxID=644 RepID=UPI00111931B4|nr:VOC family protein [Aeromonas hydrophila]MCX4104476.1 VOC family protein [Aeromonas hydrophila]TNJ24059.1 hypothetical protein CF112_02290 [Aeromonas hydrophila]